MTYILELWIPSDAATIELYNTKLHRAGWQNYWKLHGGKRCAASEINKHKKEPDHTLFTAFQMTADFTLGI